MSSGVFVLKDHQTLVAMQPASFASEDDFQRLLADFPALLSGEQIDAAAPRRWLLVSREKSIPSEENGAARWSIDHLFLDQDGVPTLVEVKRSTDTRIRREVVGQMLDYAANCVVYWPVEELRSLFESSCAEKELDPGEEIATRLGIEGDHEEFWQRVKTNLRAGRVRMLFVADQIPPELRRIVEFLNQQMDPAEVLALELRQFEGEGLKTLVPRVFGQTEEAQQKKATGAPKRQWDEASIYAEMERKVGSESVPVARRIAAWMKTTADRVWFGSGSRDGAMGTAFVQGGQEFFLLVLWSSGKVEIAFQWIMKPPFKEEARRRELLRRLNEVEGIELPEDAITRRPSIPLAVFADDVRLAEFLGVMGWFVAQLRAS
jgi:hypothetical protein